MKVLLPQPDGPMNAVTEFLRTSIVTSFNAVAAVADAERVDVEDNLAAALVEVALAGVSCAV